MVIAVQDCSLSQIFRKACHSEILAFACKASGNKNREECSLADLFQAQLAIVLLGNPIALTGGVFKFIAVHDLYCATGVLDELLRLLSRLSWNWRKRSFAKIAERTYAKYQLPNSR
jgi:hypothetical protein